MTKRAAFWIGFATAMGLTILVGLLALHHQQQWADRLIQSLVATGVVYYTVRVIGSVRHARAEARAERAARRAA